ncbi:MAG TPA: leucine-rich repeat protein [Gallicola sp.]|nr:leucine-rich repeat protein [Gallicola sp.]
MYYRRKRLSNWERNRLHEEYLERREARREKSERQREEFEKNNTYLFHPLENKKYYFSFLIMKNGNAKIMDIHGDATYVEIPEFILNSDTVSKKFEEQEDFSGKFPIKITVLGKLHVKNLKSLILPNTIGKIFEGTFSHNESLKYIQLPKYLKEIGDYAFWGCRSLTKINIPYSVVKIGDYAFRDCVRLVSINFPKKIVSYGSNFLNNTGIEVLSVPINVTNVNSAFDGLNKLKRLYIHKYVKEITATFDSIHLSKIVVDPRNEIFDSRQDCNAIIDTKSNELILGCKNTKLPPDIKILNLKKFTSYGKFLLISETNLFDQEKSPIQKFIALNTYPRLYFTFNKPDNGYSIIWYSINISTFIDDWFKQNNEKFRFIRNIDSDNCLFEVYLYKPLLDDIRKIDREYIFHDSNISFMYPFIYYKEDWQFDPQDGSPKLIGEISEKELSDNSVKFIRKELVCKCEEILQSHLIRFYSNKQIYKSEYIKDLGILNYKVNSVRKDFLEFVKDDPNKDYHEYYVDNTWVSWTEIRGDEWHEICKWNANDLEWHYERRY